MPRMAAPALFSTVGGCVPLRAVDSVQKECDVVFEVMMTKAAVDGFLQADWLGSDTRQGTRLGRQAALTCVASRDK